MYRSGILQGAGLAAKGADNVLVAGPDGQNLHGGRGNDVVIGGSGGDYLDGGAGDDVLIGGAGKNKLAGGSGADVLVSRAADSTVQSSGGFKFADHLYGGSGCDRFAFTDPNLLAQLNQIAKIFDYRKGGPGKFWSRRGCRSRCGPGTDKWWTAMAASAARRHPIEVR